jgi:hypothetical protein
MGTQLAKYSLKIDIDQNYILMYNMLLEEKTAFVKLLTSDNLFFKFLILIA